MLLDLFSPLEQFQVYPLFTIRSGFFDFSITNQTAFVFLVLFLVLIFLLYSVKHEDNSLFIVPTRWHFIFEVFYSLVLNMVLDNITGKASQRYFPLIFSLVFFIASMNLLGLVPFGYTITSHFVVTFVIGFSIFIGINIITIKTHKLGFFSLFLPAGTPLPLAFLLVPVEFLLYLFRPLSLAIRLFCNMMAGHVLLKIVAGSACSLMSFSGFLFFIHYMPFLILLPLLGLEFCVAIIQAFVFSLLICVYLRDAINLH